MLERTQVSCCIHQRGSLHWEREPHNESRQTSSRLIPARVFHNNHSLALQRHRALAGALASDLNQSCPPTTYVHDASWFSIAVSGLLKPRSPLTSLVIGKNAPRLPCFGGWGTCVGVCLCSVLFLLPIEARNTNFPNNARTFCLILPTSMVFKGPES